MNTPTWSATYPDLKVTDLASAKAALSALQKKREAARNKHTADVLDAWVSEAEKLVKSFE